MPTYKIVTNTPDEFKATTAKCFQVTACMSIKMAMIGLLGGPKIDTNHKSVDCGSRMGIETTGRVKADRVDKDLSGSTDKSKYKSRKITV